MSVQLDHFIVSCRNQVASAKRLAELLGVPWAETGAGPFSPVYLNDGLTLDFIETDESFPVEHFCFRVSPSRVRRHSRAHQGGGDCIPQRGAWPGRHARRSRTR